MIYFVMPRGGGPIKIGYTGTSVPARVKQLEANYACPLMVLRTMEGDEQAEAAIHERFAHLRLGGTEQFRPARDLMTFIGIAWMVVPDAAFVVAMPGRTERERDPSRDDVPVKVHRSIASMAKAVASHEGVSVAEVVSEAARETLGRRYAKMAREIEAKD